MSGSKGYEAPGIAGIESARQQVDIARKKAGIDRDAPVRLQRFRTVELHENVE